MMRCGFLVDIYDGDETLLISNHLTRFVTFNGPREVAQAIADPPSLGEYLLSIPGGYAPDTIVLVKQVIPEAQQEVGDDYVVQQANRQLCLTG